MTRIAPIELAMPRQRQPRITNEPHLVFLRMLSCAICGRVPVEAAHLRAPCREVGHRQTGKSEKPDDRWCVGLCADHHREQHSGKFGSELSWWRAHGIEDPWRLCLALFGASGNREICEEILSEHRRIVTAYLGED